MKTLQILFVLLASGLMVLLVLSTNYQSDTEQQYDEMLSTIMQQHTFKSESDALEKYPELGTIKKKLGQVDHYQTTLQHASRNPVAGNKAESDYLQQLKFMIIELEKEIQTLLQDVRNNIRFNVMAFQPSSNSRIYSIHE